MAVTVGAAVGMPTVTVIGGVGTSVRFVGVPVAGGKGVCVLKDVGVSEAGVEVELWPGVCVAVKVGSIEVGCAVAVPGSTSKADELDAFEVATSLFRRDWSAENVLLEGLADADALGLNGRDVKSSVTTASRFRAMYWRFLCDAERQVCASWKRRGWYFLIRDFLLLRFAENANEVACLEVVLFIPTPLNSLRAIWS